MSMFIAKKRRMPLNVHNFIKNSAYVRGYFPELMSHIGDYTGTGGSVGKYMWNNKGTLALLGTAAAAGYYLWNKYRKNKQQEYEEDDQYYTEVPNEVKSTRKGRRPTTVNYDDYDWEDNEPDESDYDDSTNDEEPDFEEIPPSVRAATLGYRFTDPSKKQQRDTNKLINIFNPGSGSPPDVYDYDMPGDSGTPYFNSNGSGGPTYQYVIKTSSSKVNRILDWLYS